MYLPYLSRIKISRSLGKGLAKLTFDEEYQKQRARRMAQKPAHIGEGKVRLNNNWHIYFFGSAHTCIN